MDFYRKGTADAHQRFDPHSVKAGSGESRANITPFRMPRSGRACRLEITLTDGSLGTIFSFPARQEIPRRPESVLRIPLAG